MIGHGIVAAVLAAGLYLLGLPPIAAGLVPVALYIGREHAQAEHRIIERKYGSRARMPWWGGFEPAAWTRDAMLDLAGPVIAAALIVFFHGVM